MQPSHNKWRDIDYQPVVRELSIEPLRAVLQPGQRALEVGCGTGSTAVTLAADGLNVEGWDINPDAIAHAVDRAQKAGVDKRTRFVAGDFVTADHLPDPADAVLLLRVLTCIPDPAAWKEFLSRIRRCVKPGGYLYLRDFLITPEAYSARYDDGMRRGWRYGDFVVPEGAAEPQFVAHHHTPEELREICRPYRVIRARREHGFSANGNVVKMVELLAVLPQSESEMS